MPSSLSVNVDLEVNKGATLAEEFQLMDKNGNPMNIEPYIYQIVVKESEATSTILLVETLTKIDLDMALLGLNICPAEQNAVYPYLFYWITQIDPNNPCDVDELMSGKIIIK